MAKKLKKHPCFKTVQKEIKKKIKEHKRAKKACPAKAKKFDLAIRELETLSSSLSAAYTGKSCPPSPKTD